MKSIAGERFGEACRNRLTAANFRRIPLDPSYDLDPYGIVSQSVVAHLLWVRRAARGEMKVYNLPVLRYGAIRVSHNLAARIGYP